jgi:DNA-binding transcriptional MerR regulator
MQELSRITGVPPGTIRYYISEGLLPKPHKTHRNMAYYDERYVGQIRLIRELQEKRFFPLNIIKRILDQSESSMDSEEIKTLMELEGKLFKNISNVPKFQPLDLDELIARVSGSVEDILEVERMGYISRQPDGRYDEDCVKIVEILKKLREAGFTVESGFTDEFLSMYKDLIEVLAKQEVTVFSKAVTGKLSFDEMTTMAETGVNLINMLLGILHRRSILKVSREINRERT